MKEKTSLMQRRGGAENELPLCVTQMCSLPLQNAKSQEIIGKRTAGEITDDALAFAQFARWMTLTEQVQAAFFLFVIVVMMEEHNRLAWRRGDCVAALRLCGFA